MNKKGMIFLIDSTLESNVRAFKTINSLSKDYKLQVFHRGQLNDDSKYYNIENCNFTSVPHTIKSFFKRTIFLGNDYSKNLKKCIKENILTESIALYNVDLWTLPAGVKLGKKFKLKIIYDSYEICAETLSQHYPINDNSLKSFFFKCWIRLTKSISKKIEKKSIKDVDLFITTNESYLSYFKKSYQINKTAIVMNCPYYQDSIETINLHEKYNIPQDKLIVLYIGWFNSGRMLEDLILACPKINTQWHFLFLGKGPLMDKLKMLSKDFQNVSIEGPFEMNDTHKLISGSDVGILMLDDSNISKHNASANKIFDFMMVGKPMLLSNSPENCRIAKLTEHYKIIETSKTELLENSINNALGHYEKDKISFNELKSMSKTVFNWNEQELVLRNSIKQILLKNGKI
jgi:glycosyltransferase involved in cell wall biosynthesis